MTQQPGESKETNRLELPQAALDRSAEGLRMADASRRALLEGGPAQRESEPSVAPFPGLPGVEPAFLNPLDSLPPPVTLAAAKRSFPAALARVDKPDVKT
jgi:hypothetical protein